MPLGSVSPFRPPVPSAYRSVDVSANVRLAGGGDLVVVTNTTTALAYRPIWFGRHSGRLLVGHAGTGG